MNLLLTLSSIPRRAHGDVRYVEPGRAKSITILARQATEVFQPPSKPNSKQLRVLLPSRLSNLSIFSLGCNVQPTRPANSLGENAHRYYGKAIREY